MFCYDLYCVNPTMIAVMHDALGIDLVSDLTDVDVEGVFINTFILINVVDDVTAD